MATAVADLYSALSGATVYAGRGAGVVEPGNISTFTLLSPTTRTATPFVAGLSFQPGDMPAGAEIELDGATGQFVPDLYHPDGSIAWGRCAGFADLAANTPRQVTFARGTAATGPALTLADLKATGITAAIAAAGFGTASWAGADWDAPFEVVCTGPLMSWWRFRKPIGSDPHLSAWLSVKLFSDGQVDTVPFASNASFLTGTPSAKSATFTYTLGGTQRFSGALDVLHHQETPLLSGDRISYWLGATQHLVVPKQNRTYLAGTKVVQEMAPEVAYAGEWTPGTGWPAQASSFTPLQQGPYRADMKAGGGDPSLAIQPGWEVAYMVSGGFNAFKNMVWAGYWFGRFGLAYRKDDGSIFRYSDYPTIQAANNDGGELNPGHIYQLDQKAGWTTMPTPTGANPPQWARSHQPSGPFLPYLVTGEPWFRDMVQLAAQTNWLSVGSARSSIPGESDVGGLVLFASEQMRAQAWTIAAAARAAYVTSPASPLRAEFDNVIAYNADFYYQRAVAQPNNPFGIVPQLNIVSVQTFQLDFYCGAWGLVLSLQVGGNSTARDKARDFFSWVSKSVVGRLGGFGPTDYNYRYATGQGGSQATVPDIAASPDAFADWDGGTGPWFANWGQVFEDTIGIANPGTDGDLQDGGFPSAQGYWGQLQIGLAACKRHNAPGVDAAIARLKGATNFSALMADALSTKAIEYAMTTMSPESEAADYTSFVPAPGTAMGIAVNSVPEVDPQGGVSPQFGFPAGYQHANSFLNSLGASWSWGVFVEANSAYPKGAFFGAGGGHGGQVAWISPWFDINARTIGLTGWDQNVPPNGDWTGLPDFDTNSDALYNPENDLRDPVTHMYAYTKNGKTSLIGLMPHLYLMTSYAPPSAGAPKGHVIIGHVQRGQDPSGPLGASPANPWMMNVVDGVTVNGTTSAPLYAGNAGSMAFVPWTRTNRTLIFLQQHPSYWWLDHSLPIPSALGNAPILYEPGRPEIGVYYTQFLPCPDMNMILCWGQGEEGLPARNGMMGLNIIGMEDDVPLLTTVAIPPRSMPYNGIMCGGAWHKVKQKFYFYEGRNTNVLHVLTPSSLDFRTCTWTWSQETFGGIVPPGITKPSTTTEDQFCDSLFSPGRAFGYVEQDNTLFYWGGHSSPVLCGDGVTRVGSPVYITPA